MSDELEIQADFYADLVEYWSQELRQLGHNPGPTDTPQDIGFRYFNLMKRRVEPVVRTVHTSIELMCPPDLQAGLNAVLKKAATGGDLNPHLSKTIGKNPDYDDLLLNDWGIHHLHLGTTIGRDGFCARTGPLLFARITDTDFYALNVLSHGAWTEVQLLECLNRNWPTSLNAFRLKAVTGVAQLPPTAKELQELRESGVTVLRQLTDGSVLMPPGWGFSTSGKSLEAVRNHDFCARVVRDWEDFLTASAKEIEQAATMRGMKLGKPAEAKLIIQGGQAYASFLDGKLMIKLPTT